MSYELIYKLTHYPGFVYKMNDHYYYIGRCQFEEVTDQVRDVPYLWPRKE